MLNCLVFNKFHVLSFSCGLFHFFGEIKPLCVINLLFNNIKIHVLYINHFNPDVFIIIPKLFKYWLCCHTSH